MEVANQVIPCMLLSPKFHYLPRNEPLLIPHGKKSSAVTKCYTIGMRYTGAVREVFSRSEENTHNS